MSWPALFFLHSGQKQERHWEVESWNVGCCVITYIGAGVDGHRTTVGKEPDLAFLFLKQVQEHDEHVDLIDSGCCGGQYCNWVQKGIGQISWRAIKTQHVGVATYCWWLRVTRNGHSLYAVFYCIHGILKYLSSKESASGDMISGWMDLWSDPVQQFLWPMLTWVHDAVMCYIAGYLILLSVVLYLLCLGTQFLWMLMGTCMVLHISALNCKLIKEKDCKYLGSYHLVHAGGTMWKEKAANLVAETFLIL